MAGVRAPCLFVLLDALERYYQYLPAEDVEGRRLFRDTERWFADAISKGPETFEGVCAALRLDPERIRQTLVRRGDTRC
jgi:hypothetical protein